MTVPQDDERRTTALPRDDLSRELRDALDEVWDMFRPEQENPRTVVVDDADAPAG